VGAALLPSVACPACWPAYAGVLSSLGLGTLMNGPFYFALIVVLLGVTLASLGYRAAARRGYGPLLVGGVASIVILTGKALGSPQVMQYGGAGLLIAASVWNNWPMIKPTGDATKASCSACCCEPESPNETPPRRF